MEEYERLTEVLYLDAKDQYMTGRYLVDVETALELAALQLAIDFGPYETKEEAFDLIRFGFQFLFDKLFENLSMGFWIL